MVYTPAAEYRGDFARCIFYMITLYPVKMWKGLGINIFSDNVYPTLNRYSTSLLMKWHAEDPVDDRERQRNINIFRHQGNRNPFVLYPTLANHIWGNKSQLPWSADSSNNPPDSTYSDLQPRYSLSDTICLRSPYVPTTASWSIDGSPATGTLIPAIRLGTGTHEFRFTSPEISGKIKIVIQ